MKAWIISIVGIVFLAVLFELVYPQGKTKQFCKSIFGVFAIFVMLSPIFNFDYSKLKSSDDTSISLNINFQNAKDESLKIKVENELKNHNISGVDVEILSKMQDFDYLIDNVYVDSTNIVLTDNITHTNKYEIILELISNTLNIDREQIIIYG